MQTTSSISNHSTSNGRNVTQRPDIPGWGSDANRGKRPAFAMEVAPNGREALSEPAAQPRKMEVLVSPEHPAMTPLFGTGPEPSGLSGLIRRYAFTFTENDVRHFLLLLLADRINVAEGLREDFDKGQLPNVLAEMGIKAEWQHNRAGLLRKAAVAGALGGVAWYLMQRRSHR